MSEDLSKRVRAAAAAGWWTVLIGGIWLALSWLFLLVILSNEPDWMLWLWGRADMSWADVHTIVFWFFGVFKLILFVCVLLSLWLTLWSRRLRRA